MSEREAPPAAANTGGLTQRDALLWLFGVATAIVTAQVNAEWPGNELVWGSLAVLVVTAVLALPKDGLLRPHRHGRTRWAGWLGVLALATYPLALLGAASSGAFLGTFLPAACLWTAVCLLLYNTTTTDPGDAALAAALTLAGVAFFVSGLESLQDGRTLATASALLIGVAALVAGAGFLKRGRGRVLLGVAFLVLGLAILVNGVDGLRAGGTVHGVASLVFGVAIAVTGVATLRGSRPVYGAAFCVASAALLVAGVAALRDDHLLPGTSLLLFGAAGLALGGVVLLSGVKPVRESGALLNVVGGLVGVGYLLGGLGYLQEGRTLVGVALVVFSGAGVFGVAIYRGDERGPAGRWTARARAFLTARTDRAGSTAASDDPRQRDGTSPPA